MNFFNCINDSLKAVHKNYPLIFIHFLFLFFTFFGLFLILSIPLGIFFVVFGIDLTDIMKGSFLEIFLSSLSLIKKFLIFAIILILSLVFYIFFIILLWAYIFSGTLGTLLEYLKESSIFSIKKFHEYGKKFAIKVLFFSIYVVVIFFIISIIFAFIGEMVSNLIEVIKKYSYFMSVFFNVFFYLSFLVAGFVVFLLWISYTLVGFFGIYIKNLTVGQTIKNAKIFLVQHPQTIGRSALLFIIYILMGGFILSLGSLLAIIPNIGPVLAAVYQIVTQIAHVYISLVVFTAFLSYYIKIEETLKPERVIEGSDTSEEVPEQEQTPLQEETPQQSQNQPSSDKV